MTATWGIGIYLWMKSFNLGIVFDEVPQVALDLGGVEIQKRHSFTLHGNYSLNLTDEIGMEFFTNHRTDLVQWQTEFGLLGKLQEKLYGSVLVRGYNKNSFDALAWLIGGRLNPDLWVAYSYDITLSPLRKTSNGSHEILLRYLIDVNTGRKIPERIMHSPRLYE